MKTKIFLTTFSFFILFSSSAQAMGAKRPRKIPPAPPAAKSSVKPTLDFGKDLDPDEYLNTSAQIGPQIDDSQADDELAGHLRSQINADEIDQCFTDSDDHDLFSKQVSYYVNLMLSDVPAKVGFIGSYYSTSNNDEDYFPTSLIRHSLCTSTQSSLSTTVKNVPNKNVMAKLNNFENTINTLRQEVLAGDQQAKKELLNHWSKFFGCLAYTESLSTSDTKTSLAVAAKVAPANYRKPAGVKFYEDPAQDAASKLNIGMFQFTPNSSGNVQPCLRAWNAVHSKKPQCQVNQKGSRDDLINVLGSSLQSFNAFCGVHKLIQTFSIQVNTSKSSATHPQNLVNGQLLPFEKRCVTPHIQAGKAYNHFGPLQNSTGGNLDQLFTCMERSQ